MVLDDLNGDGDLDLAPFGQGGLLVWLGDESGGFEPLSFAVDRSSAFDTEVVTVAPVAVRDVDSDGDPDLVGGGQRAYVFLSDGAGVLTLSGVYYTGVASSVALCDIDSDSARGIVAGTTADRIVMLRNRGVEDYAIGHCS